MTVFAEGQVTGCGRWPDQLWLKKPREAALGGATSLAVTSTCTGDSRNTLLVTRSMEPCRPNTKPAAKSTSRLASASSRSVRFMTVSYTHLRAHETVLDLVCRLLLEKK